MKRGFTLVELLTVIVVLGIIAAIAIPTIVNTIKDSRIKTCKEQVRTIENAAKRWGTENSININKTSPGTITVKQLQDRGYLSAKDNVVNPITNESMENIQINITYDNLYNQFSYKLPNNVCSYWVSIFTLHF